MAALSLATVEEELPTRQPSPAVVALGHRLVPRWPSQHYTGDALARALADPDQQAWGAAEDRADALYGALPKPLRAEIAALDRVAEEVGVLCRGHAILEVLMALEDLGLLRNDR